jgi:CYTH domain-containing protein
MKESPFACDMTALEVSERRKHIENINNVFQSVKEIRENFNGYSFLLRKESNMLINLMEFIEKERLCCPFFGFIIEIEQEGGDVWLKITGREGVKDFIEVEFGDFLSDNVSWDQEIKN